MLSLKPYPDRSTASAEELYSSTQSVKSALDEAITSSLEAMTSLMYTPVLFSARRFMSIWFSPEAVLGSWGVVLTCTEKVPSSLRA